MIRPELPHGSLLGDSPVSEKSFLESTLMAVKRRRGLIHGKLRNGGVCALGALVDSCEKTGHPITFWTAQGEAVQDANDSVPKATKAKRRAVVIKWIEKRLKTLSKAHDQ
jgi:hypothetical protein